MARSLGRVCAPVQKQYQRPQLDSGPRHTFAGRGRRVACDGWHRLGQEILPLATAIGAPLEIIAHRGASFDAPENTLAAVNLAWQQLADAVEVDVQLSKDGQ